MAKAESIRIAKPCLIMAVLRVGVAVQLKDQWRNGDSTADVLPRAFSLKTASLSCFAWFMKAITDLASSAWTHFLTVSTWCCNFVTRW